MQQHSTGELAGGSRKGWVGHTGQAGIDLWSFDPAQAGQPESGRVWMDPCGDLEHFQKVKALAATFGWEEAALGPVAVMGQHAIAVTGGQRFEPPLIGELPPQRGAMVIGWAQRESVIFMPYQSPVLVVPIGIADPGVQ